MKVGSVFMDELRQIGNEMLSPNEPHLACVLLLDTSYSMSGEPIENLNASINRFKNETSMDPMAQRRVDIAIVEFNSSANVVQKFVPISNLEPVKLVARGSTNMAQGIHVAIDILKERNRLYASMGTPCFKPWIFMITDGGPDSIEELEIASQRIRDEEAKGTHGKLKFFSLGVRGYNKEVLSKLGTRHMELIDVDFSTIFDWMSESMVAISVSHPENEAPLASMLPPNARVVPDGW